MPKVRSGRMTIGMESVMSTLIRIIRERLWIYGSRSYPHYMSHPLP